MIQFLWKTCQMAVFTCIQINCLGFGIRINNREIWNYLTSLPLYCLNMKLIKKILAENHRWINIEGYIARQDVQNSGNLPLI